VHCGRVNADSVNLRVPRYERLDVTRTIAQNTLVRVFSGPVYDYQVNGQSYDFLPITFEETPEGDTVSTGFSDQPEFWIASDFVTKVPCPTSIIEGGKGPLALTLAAVYLFLLND
jgi:hypothetical protein